MTNRLGDGGTFGASNNLVIWDGETTVAAHFVAVYVWMGKQEELMKLRVILEPSAYSGAN
jgi:hypothetical protein